ncbi:MAG: electron transport complex subunit RsxG [Betaproteobacteria bacterium]|nr:electron transport complex subunit RsxG [Betaproteobacteria bacterium]
MSTAPVKASLQTGLNLLVFAVLGTIVLTFTFNLTRDRIIKSVEDEKLKLIMQIVPPALFDNDIIKDTLIIPASKQLGTDRPATAYRARLQGKPSVVVLETVAPDGYSGKIEMIVAIREDAALAGVRVVRHKETPGLGDYIEFAKNRWISLFDGASHARYKEEGDWKVRKDGGQFDYMAGATITPRAVVKAVHKTLHYYEENRDQLFAAAKPLSQQESKQ